MARLTNAILVIIAINLAMLFFTCPNFDKNGACIVYNAGTPTIYNSTVNSTPWIAFIQPEAIMTGDFWDEIFGSNWGLIATIGAGALLVGTLVFRSDIPFYFGLGISMLLSIQIYINFYRTLIGSHVFSDPVMVILGFLIGSPLVICYSLTVIEFVGGRN